MVHFARYANDDPNRVVNNLSSNDTTYPGQTVVRITSLPEGISINHLTSAIGRYRVVNNALVPYTTPAETTQQVIDRRLGVLRRQYNLIQGSIQTWWPDVKPDDERTARTEAVTATRVWADHAVLITAEVIRGRVVRGGTTVLNTEEDKLRIISRFEVIFLNEDNLETWYIVMSGNASVRAPWFAARSRIVSTLTYVDWMDNNGNRRVLDGGAEFDGSFNVWPGVDIPPNFNPPTSFGD